MDNIWHVVGCGPSLKTFDWSSLQDKKVIAVNRSFQDLPDARYVITCDVLFGNHYWEELKKHPARKVFIHVGEQPISNAGWEIYEDDYWCGNSGIAAIRYARNVLEADRVVIAGLDANFQDSIDAHLQDYDRPLYMSTWYHDGYPWPSWYMYTAMHKAFAEFDFPIESLTETALNVRRLQRNI